MKKLIVTVITAAMALMMTLTACGSDAAPDSEAPHRQSVSFTAEEQDLFSLLKASRFHIWSESGAELWADQYSPEIRLRAAALLLRLQQETGLEPAAANPEELMAGMDAYYADGKDGCIWEAACNASDVDGSEILELFRQMMSADRGTGSKLAPTGIKPTHSNHPGFYDQPSYDSDSDDSDEAFYWYDEDGDIWFWDGEDDEFIGFGNEYYIDGSGDLCAYGDEEFDEPCFWYDEDGDIWFWNGYEDEFVGFGDEYYIGDDGDLYAYDEDADWDDNDGWFWDDDDDFWDDDEDWFW